MTKQTIINSWDWDIRVRDRNLKQGTLTDKDVEKYLGALPDVAQQSETVRAVSPSTGRATAEPSPVDDEEEDEDDEDDDDEDA